METNIVVFFKKKVSDFGNATVNLFLFLPYFFSVPTLIKTLFSPWKNLASKKTTPGFSFSEWSQRTSFNAISRGLGFLMRLSIILFYFLFQSLLIIILPMAFLVCVALIPILFLESYFTLTEEEKNKSERIKFIGTHLLNQENYGPVSAWFEDYYKHFLHKSQWWRRSNLFSIPPLARDWAVGYTPTLDRYADDLTSYSYQSNALTIVDREKEIDEIERALSKTQDASVVIVGEEGVGKHTIVLALAKKMYEGKTKNLLMYKRIVRLNMEKVLNQEVDMQGKANFFEELLTEAAEAKNIIIFIDDIEKYISSSSGIDLSTSIEKFTKTNRLQFLGITTPYFYEKFLVINERLHRLFTKIDVKEVTLAEAEKILLQLVHAFEERYNLFLPYETIQNAIKKSDFYITSIPFPEKAIDLIDSACVYFTQNQSSDKKKIIMPDVIDTVLAEKTHVPTTLTENIKQKLTHLEALLNISIVHQPNAVAKLTAALRRSFILMGKRKKPLATLLFLGPTGVGKTETAKAIAKIFFGSEAYLTRFDMSNYQTPSDIPSLIGSLNTGNPGLLVKAIRESPYGVLLLDEIEKANRDLINIFLTILDEGYFTDGFGKRVDCKNLVIIATSNAGSDLFFKNPQDSQPTSPNPEGSQAQKSFPESIVNFLVEQKIFTPEFLNRFDAVIAYNPLDVDSAKQIAQKMLREITEDIYNLHKVKLNVSDAFLSDIVKKGYDQKFGARNLDRLLRDEVEDKIAKMILEGKAKEGDIIQM